MNQKVYRPFAEQEHVIDNLLRRRDGAVAVMPCELEQFEDIQRWGTCSSGKMPVPAARGLFAVQLGSQPCTHSGSPVTCRRTPRIAPVVDVATDPDAVAFGASMWCLTLRTDCEPEPL